MEAEAREIPEEAFGADPDLLPPEPFAETAVDAKGEGGVPTLGATDVEAFRVPETGGVEVRSAEDAGYQDALGEPDPGEFGFPGGSCG